MDFGDVLDEWERIKRARGSAGAGAREAQAAWLDARGTVDKDAAERDASAERPADRAGEARRLAALRPQAVLDLHGMVAREAESAIASFIDSSARAGLEKVLVIHGKGLHSAGAPVLKAAARRALEAHPLAGRFGQASKEEGGSGALWVYLRRG